MYSVSSILSSYRIRAMCKSKVKHFKSEHKPAMVSNSRSLLIVADENLALVLDYLDGKSLCRMQRSCRIFSRLTNDDNYWYKLCRSEWGISPEYLFSSHVSNKALYESALIAIQRLTRQVIQEHCLASMRTRLSLDEEDQRTSSLSNNTTSA